MICSLRLQALGQRIWVGDASNVNLGFCITDKAQTIGNVSYVCPGFHGFYGIPTAEGAYNHTPGFTEFAGKPEAHGLTIVAAKGMAIAGWRILESETVAKKVWQDFDDDEETERHSP